MVADRREIARLQSDFYRDQFRKMLRWLIICVFIMYALIIAIVYFVLFQPQQKFFANTTQGKILSMPKAKIG